jgi:preprotein translocase subunit YajC
MPAHGVIVRERREIEEYAMFVSPAYAQAGTDIAGPGAIQAFLPIILIFVVFYFLLIRPQQKKMREHREMLAAIRRGDRVVTGGGIIGTVSKVVDDAEVIVEIAEGVRVRVQRGLISGVLAKTEPVAAPKGAANDSEPASGTPAAGDQGEKPGNTGSGLKRFFGGKRDPS